MKIATPAFWVTNSKDYADGLIISALYIRAQEEDTDLSINFTETEVKTEFDSLMDQIKNFNKK